ncbi:MAG: hypothetical protein ACKV19_24110 [Verrucomicrobiales bacterium]
MKASAQRAGDPAKGYDYLIYGDYVSSGVPLALYRQAAGASPWDLDRTGPAKGVAYRFNVVKSPGGAELVAPNCFTCHAERLNGRLVLGLGNNSDDHTGHASAQAAAASLATLLRYGPDSPEVKDSQPILRSQQAIGPFITTRVRGVNPADKIFAALAAHRHGVDLSWLDQKQFTVPAETVPTDVPAWWLMKKKHALYYNGLGRGDFARLASASGMLTLKDSAEAKAIDARFPDVMAWIRTLEPPPYPYEINKAVASRGRAHFESKCSHCHGTYGRKETYPNRLVSLEKVGTDPMLSQSYSRHPEYHTWYNQSWYGQPPHAGRLEPNAGYVAPPLDGIWATAPYLHNGSVPSLQDLLDSGQRPAFWRKGFENNDYDQDKAGWRYQRLPGPGDPEVYDTSLPGYGHGGHRFGDSLTADDRRALVEYLKTL